MHPCYDYTGIYGLMPIRNDRAIIMLLFLLNQSSDKIRGIPRTTRTQTTAERRRPESTFSFLQILLAVALLTFSYPGGEGASAMPVLVLQR